METDLRDAFENKTWAKEGKYPRSGAGSTLEATEAIRKELPEMLKRLGVRVFIDAPCGDFFWMSSVDLSGVQYLGFDISREVIDENKKKFPDFSFEHADLTSDLFPDSDLILIRDCLFHLRHETKTKLFENILKSEFRYVLVTMNHVLENVDLSADGGFQKFNPCIDPFNFCEPLQMLTETGNLNLDPNYLSTSRGSWQRSLGLWSRKQIEDSLKKMSDK